MFVGFCSLSTRAFFTISDFPILTLTPFCVPFDHFILESDKDNLVSMKTASNESQNHETS